MYLFPILRQSDRFIYKEQPKNIFFFIHLVELIIQTYRIAFAINEYRLQNVLQFNNF